MITLHSCAFVSLSDLLQNLPETMLAFNAADLDVTFGDAKHTLISTKFFNNNIRTELEAPVHEEESLSYILDNLPVGCLIDLES